MPKILEPSKEQEAKPLVKWFPCRIEGRLVCFVDAADPNHIRIQNREFGLKKWVEFWTTDILKKGAA